MTVRTVPPDLAFCQRLPKVELHAHLTGSITKDVLQTIWTQRRAAGDAEVADLEPPETALEDPSGAQGIESFFAHFNTYIYRLVNTPESLALATRAVLEDFAADGVTYLELRSTPRPLVGEEGGTIAVILREINRWNSETGTDGMVVRLIVSLDRVKHDPTAADAIVGRALALRDSGEPVVGLDLCGDVNTPIDVRRFAPAFARARAHGLGYVLHFAEVPTSSSEAELEEMISWQPKRLGHAIHVAVPMRERILAAGIAPEMCLSCNVLAGMLPKKSPADETVSPHECSPTFVDHHFGWWWPRGGSLSLGTDDVGVFGSTSAEEHLHAATHFGLSRRDLVDLGRRAMRGGLDEGARDAVEKRLDAFERDEGL